MSSLRRILSSRANGAHSLGPVTAEGKARSSQNALSHGLNSALVVLLNEDEDGFRKLVEDYRAHFNPSTPHDEDMIEEMAVAKWRQRRLWSIETAVIDLEMDLQLEDVERIYGEVDEETRLAMAYKSLIDASRILPNLSRYESRHRRAYEKALAKLENKNGQNEPSPISGQ